MTTIFFKTACIALTLTASLALAGNDQQVKITKIQQLADKEFAVPAGTVADKLVLSKFPNAKFKYFSSVHDAALAVKAGQADAAAYDQPILQNIAAKDDGLTVLPEMITLDDYGFAVRPDQVDLKNTIDAVLAELRKNGGYDAMLQRWLPESGAPAPMPTMQFTDSKRVLKLGTAAVTEPFSFIDNTGKIVGFDIEMAEHIAQHLGMTLQVVNMDFGDLIHALNSGRVDMIAACITITEERTKVVLFSKPYYTGGIAALVRK